MPHGLHVPRARQLHAADARAGHALDLLHRGVDVAVRETSEADVAVGIVADEVGEPVVVDAEHLAGRRVVAELGGGAEDAVEHLGLHAVPLHVLGAEHGIRRATDALLAILVEPGIGHDVHTVVHAGDVLLAGGPHAVHEAERRAVLAGPVRPVGTVGDVGHARLHGGGGVGREEIGGNPGEIDVTVGRDAGVVHGVILLGTVHGLRRRPS